MLMWPMTYVMLLAALLVVLGPGGARLPAAGPRPPTMSLSGCCSPLPPPGAPLCGLGPWSWQEGTALRKDALWKAGARARRRPAPPTPLAGHLIQALLSVASVLCVISLESADRKQIS